MAVYIIFDFETLIFQNGGVSNVSRSIRATSIVGSRSSGVRGVRFVDSDDPFWRLTRLYYNDPE